MNQLGSTLPGPGPLTAVPFRKLITPQEVVSLLDHELAVRITPLDQQQQELIAERDRFSQGVLEAERRRAAAAYQQKPCPTTRAALESANAAYNDFRALKFAATREQIAQTGRRFFVEQIAPVMKRLAEPVLDAVKADLALLESGERNQAVHYEIPFEPSRTLRSLALAVELFAAKVAQPQAGQTLKGLLQWLGVRVNESGTGFEVVPETTNR